MENTERERERDGPSRWVMKRTYLELGFSSVQNRQKWLCEYTSRMTSNINHLLEFSMLPKVYIVVRPVLWPVGSAEIGILKIDKTVFHIICLERRQATELLRILRGKATLTFPDSGLQAPLLCACYIIAFLIFLIFICFKVYRILNINTAHADSAAFYKIIRRRLGQNLEYNFSGI